MDRIGLNELTPTSTVVFKALVLILDVMKVFSVVGILLWMVCLSNPSWFDALVIKMTNQESASAAGLIASLGGSVFMSAAFVLPSVVFMRSFLASRLREFSQS